MDAKDQKIERLEQVIAEQAALIEKLTQRVPEAYRPTPRIRNHRVLTRLRRWLIRSVQFEWSQLDKRRRGITRIRTLGLGSLLFDPFLERMIIHPQSLGRTIDPISSGQLSGGRRLRRRAPRFH